VTRTETGALDEIGVALVGASTIAAEFMLAALRGTEGVRVTGVLSSDPVRARAFAERFGLARTYASLGEALADPDVAGVYISTAHRFHATQGACAIEAGKHVLCEKPIALSSRVAVGVMEAAERAGVVFATNHHFRNAAGVETARSMVQEGVVGEPLAARLLQVIEQSEELRDRRLDPADPGAGIIWDMTVHSADAAAYVLGDDVVRVAAQAYRRDGSDGPEDAVMGTFETRRGIPVAFFDSFNSAHAGSSLEVHGTSASLFVTDPLDELKRPRACLRTGGEIAPVDCGEPVDVYRRGVERFRDAIRGQGTPAASARAGAHSVAVAEAVREAARSGRATSVAATAS
jgi:1,5-anhydro-D-fructose reductase (1,5-anhydro-D-mannitol-forming)